MRREGNRVNVSTLLTVAGLVLAALAIFFPLRYSIRKDRVEGADRQRQLEQDAADRLDAAVRRAVTDAKEPLVDEIANLRTELRDKNKRINDLTDERARGWRRAP